MSRSFVARTARAALPFVAACLLTSEGAAQAPSGTQGATHASSALPSVPAPPDIHPRLWLRQKDLDKIRKRAVGSNPLFQDGLMKVVAESKKIMDEPAPNDVMSKDKGSWSQSYNDASELYAQVFAFMYAITPDDTAENKALRQDYGDRAKKLLMNVIGKTYEAFNKLPGGGDINDMAPGGQSHYNDPWIGGRFSMDLRAFIQDALPLTVDWIYPLLSADDKAKIRTVFLYWAKVLVERAGTSGEYDRPKPPGVYNDPQLLDLSDENRYRARFALNNFFAMHMRMLGLMSLAMDAADDVPQKNVSGSGLFKQMAEAPAGALRGYLRSATGAWLYMKDYALRNEGRGGLSPEGWQYFTAGLGPSAQFHLALTTSGWDNPMLYPDRQDQVVMDNNPFWKDLIPAYLLQLSPSTGKVKDFEWYGPLHEPAWYGDGEKYLIGEPINLFGAFGVHAEITGNAERLAQARWIATHTAPGGAQGLVRRISSAIPNGSTRYAILYFLLFDPAAPTPEDPRPKLPTSWYSPGIQVLSSRTGHDPDARWLTWFLQWNRMDHQHGEGNMIQFYRKGEWLTKKWVGYGARASASDYCNTITIQNDPPKYNSPGSWQNELWKAGSQWAYIAAGDPLVVGWSDTPKLTYTFGDATPLYNSKMDNSMSVAHASRSAVWLKPDHLVIYDRVASKEDGRFKRFWLNFQNEPKQEGTLTTATTNKGQQLFVRTLLPEKAALSVNKDMPVMSDGWKQTAAGEPMRHRLQVDAPNEKDTRFLHVLQGADAGAAADTATLLRSSAGRAFEGAIVNGALVLFPKDFGEPATEVNYESPAGVTAHYLTGLLPSKTYVVTATPAGGGFKIEVKEGAAPQATGRTDAGGVLVLNEKASPVDPPAEGKGGAATPEAIRAAAAGLPAPANYTAPAKAAPGGIPTSAMPGPAPSPPPRAGCGCGTTGGTSAMFAPFGALALAAVLRRRSLSKRGKVD